jgi:hypothetical protein
MTHFGNELFISLNVETSCADVTTIQSQEWRSDFQKDTIGGGADPKPKLPVKLNKFVPIYQKPSPFALPGTSSSSLPLSAVQLRLKRRKKI